MPLLEAIEQKATAEGVPVDARVSRGRTYRDALQRLLEQERFDRVIVSATDNPRQGLSEEDLAWLLRTVPAEVLILRPAPDDARSISASGAQRPLLSRRSPGDWVAVSTAPRVRSSATATTTAGSTLPIPIA